MNLFTFNKHIPCLKIVNRYICKNNNNHIGIGYGVITSYLKVDGYAFAKA
ncbi:hypothetical protein JCM19294_854 [Nonlabens tegetincola]|uniref:Uncharacterized protein n=1 Tax=Nonlabens tegetincola TaxID=323273 RepID=A0A090Q5D3_9FLAO|nr:MULTISPECIES: hypothetical protein [Nonlabens]GAK98220.1 hypothetical protein JCM19294_854 [Nonlabens tegetincola]